MHRILKILMLIQGSSSWTVKRLAEECGCHERSIHRYISDMQEAGIRIVFDRESGYRLNGEFYLPPVHLAVDEALAMAVLCEHVAEREQIPCLAPAARALTKVRAALPSLVRDELEDLEGRIAVRLAKSSPQDECADVYDTIRLAIAEKRALECRYDSNTSPESDWFRFDPYVLFFSVRAWYAVGHHHGRGEVRSLKLGRFTGIRETEKTFHTPRGFDIDDHLGNAWRMIRGDEEHEVEIVFDAEFATTISETRWHRTQEMEEREDGSLVFRCRVAGLDEIVWWVLSMGPHCKVVKPRELAERVRDLARGAAGWYGG
ncbi:MAG: WYL domain-containing protein [Planctomycetota bacterium]|nr:WYL domain-containing protein [Planctomycetota bacterium]